MTLSRILAALLAAASLAATSRADVITTLYNTGVNNGGGVLAHGAVDSHYTLVTPGGAAAPKVMTSAGGWPIVPGIWLGDNSSSAWLGVGTNAAPGIYTYTTTFDLTGLLASTAQITGRWSTDNAGLDILLNGVSTGKTAGGFTAWSNFNLTSGFVSGLNTLKFVVRNDSGSSGNPVGLRVEMTGTASPIPTPAAFWLAGIGGLTLLGRARRRAA